MQMLKPERDVNQEAAKLDPRAKKRSGNVASGASAKDRWRLRMAHYGAA